MTITVKTEGVEAVTKLVSSLPFWCYKGARAALADYVKAVDTSIKLQTSGVDLNVRTGNLRRSFNFDVYGDFLSTLGAVNYNTAKYAPIHQFGGTIWAKNAYKGVPGGPYLNIPVGANLTPSGVQRFSAAQVFADGGHIVKTTASWKAPYVVMLRGQNMFALVKYVEIPKRLEFIETAEKGIPTLLTDLADAAFIEGEKA